MDPKTKNMKYDINQEYRLKESRLECFRLNDQLDRSFNFIQEMDKVIVQLDKLIAQDPKENKQYSNNLDIMRRERGQSLSEFKQLAFALDFEFARSLSIMDERPLSKLEIDSMMAARERRKLKTPHSLKRLNQNSKNAFIKAEGLQPVNFKSI